MGRKRGRRRSCQRVRRGRRTWIEALEPRLLLAADWRNPLISLDTDGDQFVSPIDVLLPINYLNEFGSGTLSTPRAEGDPYLDVDGDGSVSPIDPLQIINAINEGFALPLVLDEGSGFANERSFAIGLGQDLGTRTYRFEVSAQVDNTDRLPALEDLLAVYLVDESDRSQTLLAAEPGAPLFAYDGTDTAFQPGQVKFDGTIVEIDLTSVQDREAGQLVFQLLNNDADQGTVVSIRPLSNTVDQEAGPNPQLAVAAARVLPAALSNPAATTSSLDVSARIGNASFDPTTGRFSADIQLQNHGAPTGRDILVGFPGLPDGVTVVNAQGELPGSVPFIDMRAAIPPGGLRANELSKNVRIEIDNPSAIPFSLTPDVFVGEANRPPVLPAIPALTVMPGGRAAIDLAATDPDGDEVTYSIRSDDPLPTGMLAGNQMVFTPTPQEIGGYTFELVASDGSAETVQSVSLDVIADTITTTRLSGIVEGTDHQPLANVPIELGDVQTTTAADGSFLLEAAGGFTDDTLKIRGEAIGGPEVYPFIAEKLQLLLSHEPFVGFNNVIARPIYLPEIDMANAMTIDPTKDTTVSTDAIPGASIFVAAGTLEDQQGQMFTGQLSITEVPPQVTPAALPPNLRPDLVVTIQPGDMVFTQPAPLNFPNTAGYAPGSMLDLWSINPQTGLFEDVGDMQVSGDGLLIETISGGVNNSSWHFPAPPEPEPEDDDDGDEDNDCDECKDTAGNFEVELHSGAVLEDHALVSYQSAGQTQGFALHYDSLRADPRPILHLNYSNLVADDSQRLVASLEFMRGDFMMQLPGHAGGEFGLQGGEHFWKLDATGTGRVALQADFTMLPSGAYTYRLTSGPLQFDGEQFTGTTTTQTKDLRVVNTANSPFGAGWGLNGLWEIVENSDGSVLLIDGGGSELYFKAPANAGQPLISPPGDFSTLVKLPAGTYQRTMTDQTVYQFEANHRVASRTDRNGNVWRFDYDASGILAKITDPADLETVFASSGGRINTITDPAGRVTTLEYDAAGNLTRIVDPDDTSNQWAYDASHRMRSHEGKRGFTEQVFYDFAGRAERSIRKDGTEQFYDPVQTQVLLPFAQTTDPTNSPSVSTTTEIVGRYADPNGNVTTTVLDKQGQAVVQTDGEGRMTSLERNPDNLVAKLNDARGNPSLFDYDDRGNVTAIADTLSRGTNRFALDLIEGQDQATEQMVDALLGPGSSIAVVDGSPAFVGRVGDGVDPNTAQSAVYEGLLLVPGSLDFPTISNPDGILLTSGVANLPRTNTSMEFGAIEVDVIEPDTGSDDQLVAILDDAGLESDVHNVNSIAFSFHVPAGTTSIEADFVFGSDEFPDQSVTDIFAFIVDGTNYATFPDGSLVSFVEGANAVNFVANDASSRYRLEYDGISNSLHIAGLLDLSIPAGQPHTLKIAIANTSDEAFDSGVFIGNLVAGTATQASSGVRATTSQKTFVYDDTFSQITETVDELGRRVLFKLDPATGNRLESTRVIGELDDAQNGETDDLTTTMTYTQYGLVDTTTDELGRLTDYDYDGLGRLTEVTFAVGTPDEASQLFEYDPAGNQTATVDENGNRTEFVYDALNRLTQIIETDPDGTGPLSSPVTRFTYDDIGNLATTTDARNNTTTNTYDELNRLATSTDHQDNRTTFHYDPASNLSRVIDPLGNTTTNEYDGRNRLVATVDPDGGVTRFSYDFDDNMVALTDPIGNETRFEYDARNRLVEEVDPLGNSTFFSYDAADNLVRKVDRDARVTEFEYDAINRLTAETWIDSDGATVANAIHYEYDAASNLLSVQDAYSAFAFTYDARDRAKSVDNAGTPNTPHVVLTYTYDGLGNVLSVTDAIDSAPGATTSYAYDGLNRTISTEQSGNDTADKLVDFVYNELGQFDLISRYSDLSRTSLVAETDYEYDSLNRLIDLVHTNAADEILAFYEYEYDSISRLTGLRETDGLTEYAYDGKSQLTAADRDAGDVRGDESYLYDANGNRTNSHVHDDAYEIGSANRLLSDGTYSYAYDAEGNMIGRTEIATGSFREFQWDHRNRLVAVNDFDQNMKATQLVGLTYDAFNRRLSKSVDGDGLGANPGATTHFVYDRAQVLLDFLDSDTASGPQQPALDKRYLPGPSTDQILAQDAASTSSSGWFLADHLGTIRLVVDRSGVVVNSLSYDAYGNLLTQSNPLEQPRYAFTGREFDQELGLYYYRNRYLDSNIGKFLSEDPIRFSGQQANLNGYVGNNPVSFRDSSGTRSETITGSFATPSITDPQAEFSDLSTSFDPSIWPPRVVKIRANFRVTATVNVGISCTRQIIDDCGNQETETRSLDVTARGTATVGVPIPIDPGILAICAAVGAAAGAISGGSAAFPAFTVCTRAALLAKIGWIAATYGPKAVELAQNELLRTALATLTDPDELCKAAF